MADQIERSEYKGLGGDIWLGLRAIKMAFTFTGRSSRTELIIYYVASHIVVILLGFIVSSQMPIDIIALLQLVILIPLPALFVRRLHDQNTRWFGALPAIAVIAFDTYTSIRLIFFDELPNRNLLDHTPIYLAALALVIVAIVLLFRAGDVGANEYGADPRGRE